MKLEVRCCCDARRVMGTMEVDENLRGEFFAGPENLKLEVAPYMTGAEVLARALGGPRQQGTLAVKSNDYSLEQLRKIPGFEESPKANEPLPEAGEIAERIQLLAEIRDIVGA